MAISSLDRDYTSAWPLLQTALTHAAREQRLKAQRAKVVITPAAGLGYEHCSSAELRTIARDLHERAQSLHMLDAYAIVSGEAGPGAFERTMALQEKITLQSALLRVLRWCETWTACRTERAKAEQALISLLLIREAKLVSTRVGQHLDAEAKKANSQGRLAEAFRLRTGAVLCKRDPTPKDVRQLGNTLSKATPEVKRQEMHQLRAVARTAPKTNPYVVHMNRIRGQANKTYERRLYRKLSTLKRFLSAHAELRLHNSKRPRSPKVAYDVGVDFVGAVDADRAPAVYSLRLQKPKLITRGVGKQNSRQWWQDLIAFTERDMGRTPATISDLIDWHEPGADAEAWLKDVFDSHAAYAANLAKVRAEMQSKLRRMSQVDFDGFIGTLTEAIRQARAARPASKYTPYRLLDGWRRSVNRPVMDGETSDAWVVKLPPKREATAAAPLRFNHRYNYALIDYCHA